MPLRLLAPGGTIKIRPERVFEGEKSGLVVYYCLYELQNVIQIYCYEISEVQSA